MSRMRLGLGLGDERGVYSVGRGWKGYHKVRLVWDENGKGVREGRCV